MRCKIVFERDDKMTDEEWSLIAEMAIAVQQGILVPDVARAIRDVLGGEKGPVVGKLAILLKDECEAILRWFPTMANSIAEEGEPYNFSDPSVRGIVKMMVATGRVKRPEGDG